jgi:alginate O-acetyltransferase complex protein AlgI
MEFSSILFVCCFLVLFLGTQLLLRTPKQKNIALLAFSLVFYGWNGPGYLLLLLAMAGLTWFGGLLIQNAKGGKEKRKLLGFFLVLLLALIAIFRYRGLICQVTRGIFGVPSDIPSFLMPLGIAYYSLMLISYLLDISQRTIRAEKRFWVFLLYGTLFHVAYGGPVVRYGDIQKQLGRRKLRGDDLSQGISRFSIGLAKLAILAQTLGTLSDTLLDGTMQPALGTWLGLVCFALCWYFRLSGYADMAIGLGRLSGLRYPEQFDHPFTAYTIADFWSKCQMSVISFFEDYLSDPIGDVQGTGWKEILKMLGVWLLIGLWQGAGLNYLIWAFYFWLLLILEQFILWRPLEKAPWVLRRVITLILVLLSFTLLRCEDLSLLPTLFKGLVGFRGLVSKTVLMTILNHLPILVLSVVAATPLGTLLRSGLAKKGEERSWALVLSSLWEALHPALLLILSAMAMAGPTTDPFLFFQF